MPMQTRVELCHVDTLRCVVRVGGWQGGELIGSALGEAANAEEAEERAIARLQSRLEISRPASPAPAPAPAPSTSSAPTHPVPTPAAAPAAATSSVTPSTANAPPSETPTDPEDWSEELAAIELELKRIGWQRDQEVVYLTRAFGHSSRHKLTRYADLVAYLRQLRQMQTGETPDQAPVPLRRGDLIQQGDQMLKQLNWNSEQARGFLQQQMQASSRQQLSDEQLMQFNMLLEEKMIAMC